MTIFDGIALGLVQGLTEIIPVSSSGHLILFRDVLDITLVDALTFDVWLHFATALAVFVYFRKDMHRILSACVHMIRGVAVETSDRVLVYALVIGTVPAALIGFFFEEFISAKTRGSIVVVGALIVGSILFIVAEHIARSDRALTPRTGLALGFFQALALIPGMSRSGSVIAGGLLFGLSREEATRFAFLLSFPIIIGAGLVKLMSIDHGTFTSPVVFGGVAACVSGLFSIHFMLQFLRSHTLLPFAIYRVLLAVIVFLYI